MSTSNLNPDLDDVRKLDQLIRDVKFAMLTTIDANDELVSRPLTTLEVDFNGTLWFMVAADRNSSGTSRTTLKSTLRTHRPSKGNSSPYPARVACCATRKKPGSCGTLPPASGFPAARKSRPRGVLSNQRRKSRILGLARRDGSASARLRESQAHGRQERTLASIEPSRWPDEMSTPPRPRGATSDVMSCVASARRCFSAATRRTRAWPSPARGSGAVDREQQALCIGCGCRRPRGLID